VRFSATMRKISSRRSLLVGFLPTTACLREIHFQYSSNPARCQRTTVSGCTITSAPFHPGQSWRNRTQKTRSEVARRGREHLWVAAASCCRKARFSKRKSRREHRSPVMSIRKRFNGRSMAPFSHRRHRSARLFEPLESALVRSFGEAQRRSLLSKRSGATSSTF
jgi:hypothetical protein